MAKQRTRGGKPRGVTTEKWVEITDPEVLLKLSGEESCNLKRLGELLDIKVSHVRGGILAQGQDSAVSTCCKVIEQLSELISQGSNFKVEDIEDAVKHIEKGSKSSLEGLFSRKISIPHSGVTVTPRNEKQRYMVELVEKNDVIFAAGPAGTGKTYLSIALAIEALLTKRVKRIVLSRPAVEAGEKLGFLPGDMAEKVNPYLQPLYDALHDLVGAEKLEELFEKKMLEIAPLAFMRGRTLSSACVILDEAQNTTPVQMKMFLTRLGKHSKFFITGDVSQLDLPRGQACGMSDAMRRLAHVDGIAVIKYTSDEVVRHPLLKRILGAYESASD